MNHFLTDPGIQKKNFNSFEIEKNNFSKVFEVNIYSHLEPLHIKINREKRYILIQVDPFVCDFCPADPSDQKDYYFQLPENVETEDYQKSKKSFVTSLTFHKKDDISDGSHFSKRNIYNELFW